MPKTHCTGNMFCADKPTAINLIVLIVEETDIAGIFQYTNFGIRLRGRSSLVLYLIIIVGISTRLGNGGNFNSPILSFGKISSSTFYSTVFRLCLLYIPVYLYIPLCFSRLNFESSSFSWDVILSSAVLYWLIGMASLSLSGVGLLLSNDFSARVPVIADLTC